MLKIAERVELAGGEVNYKRGRGASSFCHSCCSFHTFRWFCPFASRPDMPPSEQSPGGRSCPAFGPMAPSSVRIGGERGEYEIRLQGLTVAVLVRGQFL